MRRFALALATIGIGSIGLSGQQPAPSAQSAPLFRAGVEYVELDAVVTDKNDRPVHDLEKSDFAISEQGTAQTISTFQFVSFPPVHRTVVDVKTTAPKVDVATNAHPAMGRQWVLLVDDLHLFEQHIVQTKQVIQTFLESISPDDQVAVVFSGHSNLSQDFTSDLGALMQTVNRIHEALGFAEDTPAAVKYNRANCGMRSQNARSTLDVVRNVTTALVHSTYPRKALVFVSNGLDYDLNQPAKDLRPVGPIGECFLEDVNSRELLGTLIELFQKARRAGVPVYTVPPTGLMMPEDTTRHGLRDTGAFRAETDFMHVVAENTGGRAFVGRSDMIGAIHELVDDNSNFYLLGYYPEPLVRDAKFHDVKVSLVGHPGFHIRSKAGYAAPSATPATAATARATLDEAISAALPSGGLTLRAIAAPMTPADKGVNTVVTFEVTYPAPGSGSTRIDDDLQTSIVALDPDGKIKATSGRALHVSSTVPDGAANLTFLINDTITLPSQGLMLRVGVASQALGKAGTIQLPVEPPKPSDAKLQWGGVVVGFTDFLREPVLRGDVIKALVPFQPTTTRVFKPTDSLRIFGRLFWGATDSAADVTITIDGAASRAPQIVHVNGVQTPGSGSRREGTLTSLVSMAGLEPGAYTLHLEARLSSGQPVRHDIAFEVK